MLVAAVRLDADRVLAWWNLARLTAGDRDRNVSASFYAEALARSTPATVAALHHDVLATRPPRGPVLYADDR